MRAAISSILLAPAALALTNGSATSSTHNPRYDYIVVGGGTSGLVVANRLSEDFNYGEAFGTTIDWQYESVAQIYAGGAPQVLRAGKALGGTSTINGMTYLGAEASQIDAWGEIGNSGWSWKDLMPYYKKSEHFQLPSKEQLARGASFAPDFHGKNGPLAVGWTENMMGEDVMSSINETTGALGLPFNREPNAGSMRGLTAFPKTIQRAENVREDAGRAYYWPISKRPNLDLFLESIVEKMIWHPETGDHDAGRTASGVVLLNCNGTMSTILANREVILSAGSLKSPLILEQSGIGNPSPHIILKQHNIDVVVDLPFVGENLQDQTTTDTSYANSNHTNFTGLSGYAAYFNVEDVFGNSTASFNTSIADSIADYASRTANASGIIDRNVTEKLFRMQYGLIFEKKISISEIIVAPAATGPITIEYWGPFALFAINPNYFMLDYDVQQQIATAKMARRFANTAPFSDALAGEVSPGLKTLPANASDADWAKWLKSTYHSNFHYISSAAMMPRELGGVVNSNLTVYGTSNVRVVDASVVPFQICGHLTSTLYAIAEKAADMIKALV
ncbi:hypothetical protein ACEQ8H_008956 [Pleosporales sp. CAS-2024a]